MYVLKDNTQAYCVNKFTDDFFGKNYPNFFPFPCKVYWTKKAAQKAYDNCHRAFKQDLRVVSLWSLYKAGQLKPTRDRLIYFYDTPHSGVKFVPWKWSVVFRHWFGS